MTACSQGGTRSIKVVLALACLCASRQLLAASAGGRGVPDSVLTTVVGNDGDGAVSATTVPLVGLTGAIARDSAGNLYFSDVHRIMKLTPAGLLTTYAGQRGGSGAFQGDGAPAATARFNTPNILTTDPNDNLYVVDSGNFRIRKITKAGVVSTVVGNGVNAGAFVADIGRFATDARLPSPVSAITVNAAGDIFFASTTGGAALFIYEVPAATGQLTIFAGSGVTAATVTGSTAATSALGTQILGMALLSDGSIIYSTGAGVVNIAGGKLNVVAGLVNAANTLIAGAITFPDNGTQAALNASPASTVGFTAAEIANIAVDGSTIFFQDIALKRIRSFTIGGKVSTVFGEISQPGQTSAGGFRGNGTPAATNTPVVADFTLGNDDPKLFNLNRDQLVASGGVVTFVDDANWCVRQFTVGGNVNTIAGTPNPVRTDAKVPGASAFQQALSNTSAVDAKSVVLTSPTQIARDPSNGTFVFDATDIFGNHDIMRYDPVAKQVSLVAGIGVTNSIPVASGDGGPAVTAKPIGLGTQVATIAGGTAVFADTAPFGISSNTIRAVSPAGIITTVAGIPGVAGNRNPDVDLTIVNAAGAAVNQPRIGSKATSCLFNHPDGVIATSASDLVIADTNNGRVVVVAAGTVTQDIVAGIIPTYVVALSPTVVVVADNTVPCNLVNINYTAAPVVAAPVACNAGVNCRGLATGTLTSGAVVFVASGTVIDVRLQAGLGTYYTTTVPVPGATALIGMGSDGTNLYLTDTGANKLVRIPIAQFTGASGTAAPVLAPTVIANNFLGTVTNNGFNLQTNFSLTAFAPVNLIGANVLVGDDGADQYRLLTLGATAPATTFVPFAGTGVERNGGVDGEPALNADSIGPVGGIAVDSTGAVFFSDQTERTVRKVAAGVITTVAGIPAHGNPIVLPNVDFQDGVNALQTTFASPAGLAFNPAGELFIADTSGNAVRKLKTDGTIANVAGTAVNGGPGASGDLGLAINAHLNAPGPIASDPHGDLYILQTQDGRIRVVDPVTGIITSLAGGGKDPADSVPTDSKDVDLPSAGMTLDVAGKIFVTGNQNSSAGAGIVRVAGGLAQEVCGDHIVSGFNGDGLSIDSLLNFGLSGPAGGISFDGGSGIVFCDTGNNLVRMITNLGEIGNTPPTAIIVATPATLGAAPFKPHLDGSTSTDPDGDIVNYQWDFGDGTTGSGPVVDHDYTAMGSYVVALTVTDSAGNTNTARSTVISAIPLLGSTTSGKGAFKITFGGKPNSDSFSFSVTGIVLPGNVSGINLSGLPFTIFLGTFTGTGTTGGKGPKKKSTLALPFAAKGNKNISATVDSTKGTVAASIKGATLAPAFADFGVTASNSDLGTRTALVPVVINIGGGTAVFGDRLNFFYKTKVKTSKGKTSGSASGKFSQ